ncbi:hypothetical protein NW761_000718 [Fusarium oxysporum]|nr:hypothetical protein NW758_002832 [Fusarium oxysporum]KAJ4056297.1 hypothetical protein NW763_007052 [Fusarium oxysporum]KAJ4064623.1 hypothetical protein NW753_003085 [Fusarium oxysporum]KAJ4074866.1 hypothetical protein NW756_013562 [Fusarium oxysporum]KAJ4106839.1 hypothetical protein NW761_000718 [Fusarium oxysporum]
MATMLNTNSLQPPKTGSSRWSKALPDVPGPDDPSFYDDYYEEPSPRLPPAKELPPPPPRSTSIANAKPLPPSLPPLHLLAVDSPPSGPPKMAIPRRPIGKLPANPPPLPQKEPQQPNSSQIPPSPSESLSSILSAYSRSSGESLVRSPYEANDSVRQSEAISSPSHQAPPANTNTGTFISPSAQQQQHHYQQQQPQQYVAQKLPANHTRPPPLPSKDTKYHLPATPAPVRKPVPENKLSELNSASSPSSQQQPQPQLWRRRSSKAERSLELPDLKLVASHGSTAATQPVVAPPHVQQQLSSNGPKISTIPNWQPGSTNPIAPAGQDSQTSPAAEQVPDTPTMGINSSKLNRLKGKLHLHRRGKSSGDTSKSSSTPRPGANRPPTPEYQKEDIKTPVVDSFVSPLSPASSPEPAAQVSPEIPTDATSIFPQAQTQEHLRSTGSITRKAVQVPRLPSPSEDKPVSVSPEAASLPPSVTDSRGSRGSSGSDTAIHQVQPPTEVSNRFPPRHSSVRSNAPPRQSAAEHDPRLVPSESQGPLYRGRDGTLYPEMKVLQEPDPRAAYFPKQSESPIPEGTIFKAPPLKKSHFNCYHGHKTMNRRTNRYYPLTCQTCDKSDVEDRWTCSFCHLRICEHCVKKLNNSGNDLRRLVGHPQLTS